MAGLDDDTRKFRRRLDDQPVRWWTTRLAWFIAGVISALAYSAIGHMLAEGLHRAPR